MNRTALLAIFIAAFCAAVLTGCTTSEKSPDQTPGTIVGRPGQI